MNAWKLALQAAILINKSADRSLDTRIFELDVQYAAQRYFDATREFIAERPDDVDANAQLLSEARRLMGIISHV